MSRLTLTELAQRCQKPAHREIGNWMARRVARPLALRITWVIAPWGISAHAATLVAWAAALAAATCFAQGTEASWLAGAALLQLWYVLDHVDGQLARYHGTSSLDGVQLDYLMHHTVNLFVPIGLGSGLARVAERQPGVAADSTACMLMPVLNDAWSSPAFWHHMGVAAGLTILLTGLLHDARYKAFIQRLKRVRGELLVIGGGGARPQPQPGIPRGPLRLAAWCARKLCEMHVLMNLLLAFSLVQWALPASWLMARILLCTLTLAGASVATASLWRGLARGDAEAEFARWYRAPANHALVFRDGWWHVESVERTDSPPFPHVQSARGHAPAQNDKTPEVAND